MTTRRISDGPASYLPRDDIARRQELIWQIHTLSETSRWDETTKETGREAVFWGLLHTLDITGLSNLLEQTQKDSENIDRFGTHPSVFKIAYRCGKLARVFREAPIKPIPRPSEPELDKARLRDGHKCIITGWCTTDVGHIFPHHARTRMSEVYSAVMEMDLVWSRKYRHALYSKLSEGVIDSVSNMLCMDRPAKWLWSEGFFALEPLDDNIDYEMEAPTALPSSDSEGDVEMAGTTRRTKKMGRPLDHPDIYLLDANGRPVETGRIVEIHSEDEGALPDRDLIRLHWDMLRVHALAGGADRSFYMNAFHSLDYDYEKRAARKAFTAAVISKCRNTNPSGPLRDFDTPSPHPETEQVEEERAPQDPPPGFFQTMRRRSVGFLLGQRFW
ncbi:hypothetical protein CSOJ01_04778 [Colletotrichum sojae]|uniref:HNH nuclease domain-containing protein n=1 Tax=Colletotrichum sojae TaxID=2175907 RepID=A0A8H6MXX2_9PEZI|nr:hypothetical protein CSOJ01_04778 [Colletotrichum sojae]